MGFSDAKIRSIKLNCLCIVCVCNRSNNKQCLFFVGLNSWYWRNIKGRCQNRPFLIHTQTHIFSSCFISCLCTENVLFEITFIQYNCLRKAPLMFVYVCASKIRFESYLTLHYFQYFVCARIKAVFVIKFSYFFSFFWQIKAFS